MRLPAVDFRTEPQRISFFARERGLSYSAEALNDAIALLKEVKNTWIANKNIVSNALKPFQELVIPQPIVVSILPSAFSIGASETEKGLILFGQPLRCRSFSSAILAHEITHIFLARSGETNRMVCETIAFLVEADVYRHAEHLDIRDIWNETELDQFHQIALRIAVSVAAGEPIQDRRLAELLSEVRRVATSESLRFVPPSGLLRNLKPVSKGICDERRTPRTIT